jgi:hypothetical protein
MSDMAMLSPTTTISLKRWRLANRRNLEFPRLNVSSEKAAKERHIRMPGSGNLLRIEFPDETPKPALIAVLLVLTNVAGSFAADYWVEHFAPRQPSLACAFPVTLRAGVVAFVPSWLGRYEKWSLSLTAALLVTCFLIFGWYVIKGKAVLRLRPPEQR